MRHLGQLGGSDCFNDVTALQDIDIDLAKFGDNFLDRVRFSSHDEILHVATGHTCRRINPEGQATATSLPTLSPI
jgi:hypothetical protein